MGDNTKSREAGVSLTGPAAQGDGGFSDAASEQIASVQQTLGGAPSAHLHALCDEVSKFEHWVEVGEGTKIHVIERFSGRAVLRSPRRAVLMLPAALSTNRWFDAEVADDPSYNALHQAATRGFFAFAMSYEGFGESTRPSDGAAVTAQRILDHAGAVLEWIRIHRSVPKVDLYGTSIGAGVAMALGGLESPITYHHVNRVVISTTVYKQLSPLVQSIYTPEFKAFLLSRPGGYITTTPASYAPILAGMDPAVVEWANAKIPGQYPVGPTLETFDLPFFEAASGRAPLLKFWGSESPTMPRSDVEQLGSEYGGPFRLVVYEGAAHFPMLEPVRHRFWDDMMGFLDEGSHEG